MPRGRKRLFSHCTVNGCKNLHLAKGLCGLHYQRLQKTGTTVLAESIPVSDEPLTADRLRKLVIYEPESGAFSWQPQVSRHRAKHGSLAIKGSSTCGGYKSFCVDGRHYQAHRLAWLYVHGAWPEQFIDHINGDRTDNRIANLRVVTRAENAQNRRTASKHSKTRLLGVTPNWNKFMSRICVGGVDHYLGLFDTAEEAHKAYLDAKRRLHSTCTI